MLFLALLLAFLTVFSGAADALEPPERAKVVDARVAGDNVRTRFIIDMDREIAYHVSFIANPNRVIIDLPEVEFDFPEEFEAEGRGLVESWRYGQVFVGRSRVVLDLTGPVNLDKSFLLPGVQDQPTRLVLDLVEADQASFEKQAQEFALGMRPQHSGKSDRAVKTAAEKSDRPVIVIDPGHGGIDSGAVGDNGTLEKTIVLRFAKFLKEKLEEEGNYTIHLTRDDDRFIPLRGRVNIARELQADLFISVHADSILRGASTTRGASIYTLSERASDRLAEALAQRENRSDLLAGVDLSEEPDEVGDILVDLARREAKNFSIHFARLAVEELKSATKLINNPLRSAGFQVLKSYDIPSVLIELGFLSNSLDEKMLGSDEWRDRVSFALVQAINSFFKARIAQNVQQD
ncbi:N-acetylmuramoyl-L-alanine amidase [Pseudovibrio exalbescens]|uniref:N-acetylmuramoyl-L-alanine amidase n=1 Tax=Pseudovibrio exalbescens TaxID=197461 RepID=UPI0023662620|nr:N-acetylmuramoyl-L-alanine amidase [Pseudovibrio exalbescens]